MSWPNSAVDIAAQEEIVAGLIPGRRYRIRWQQHGKRRDREAVWTFIGRLQSPTFEHGTSWHGQPVCGVQVFEGRWDRIIYAHPCGPTVAHTFPKMAGAR